METPKVEVDDIAMASHYKMWPCGHATAVSKVLHIRANHHRKRWLTTRTNDAVARQCTNLSLPLLWSLLSTRCVSWHHGLYRRVVVLVCRERVTPGTRVCTAAGTGSGNSYMYIEGFFVWAHQWGTMSKYYDKSIGCFIILMQCSFIYHNYDTDRTRTCEE